MDSWSWPSIVARVALTLAASLAFLYWQVHRDPRRHLSRSAASLISVLITATIAVAVVKWNALLQQYGLAVFLVLPFASGLLSVLLYGWQHTPRLGESLRIGLYTVLAMGAVLILGAIEGLICLVMAAPLVIPLTLAGSAVGYWILQVRRHRPQITAAALVLAIAAPPSAVEIEHHHGTPPPLFTVTTTLDIPAPPETVWQATLAPSRLERPDNIAFRAGIAYPRGAWIEGSGPGATRYCDFSTGRLVEPVLEWKQPERLRFTVTQNPEPMEELSPWGHLDVPHLHGFLVSKQGQFRLIPIPGGTRLEATTWYQHGLYPAGYWRWWSDAIIHRIHEVVLTHIRDAAVR